MTRRKSMAWIADYGRRRRSHSKGDAMIEIQNERLATLKKQTDLLIDWLREQGIKYDDAMPVLAVTIGTILKLQCRGIPKDVHDAHLMQGVEIAHGMMMAAAFNMPRQALDLLKH
jgi:hypothetical protein